MNHAKLETYRIFDASIVPVCTGGLRVPDSGFRAAFAAKSGGHAARQLGRPAAPGRIRRCMCTLGRGCEWGVVSGGCYYLATTSQSFPRRRKASNEPSNELLAVRLKASNE